jgi:hypothetical protein
VKRPWSSKTSLYRALEHKSLQLTAAYVEIEKMAREIIRLVAENTQLLRQLRGQREKPLLGLATTRQLLTEIKARGEVEATVGRYETEGSEMAIGAASLMDKLPGSMLSYRTADEPDTEEAPRPLGEPPTSGSDHHLPL